MSKLNECPNRLPDGKCLIRESEIQGSELLKNLPCLMTQAFHCEHYDLKVNPKKMRYKNPAKMSDAELKAHVEKSCPSFPCDGEGCAVVLEHKEMCRNYTIPKIPIGEVKQRFCECGEPLQPRARYCDACKKKKRKLTWQKARNRKSA